MQRNLASLFLQYARLDRKRSVEGLSASETELLAKLSRYLTSTLTPQVPRGAERRNSIRVPTELACRWALRPRGEDAHITTISRTGAFVRTPTPAPIGEEISISIALPGGGRLEVPGCVANQLLASDPERRGMGIRFGKLAPEAMQEIHRLYEHSIVRQYGSPEETLKPDEPTSE